MPTVETELFTVADYRAMPEGPPYYQLIEGELIMAPSPGSFHQDVALNIAFLLRRHVTKHRLGKVCIAPLDVFLPDDNVLQPDVFFLSRARLPLLQADGVHGAPDLVVEIISPSTATLDKKRKRALYARCGVQELWLVDPVLAQIHRYVFATDATKPVRIVNSEETFESPLLPGLVVSAVDVFQR
jgi:Uma2 family endonuclease